MWDGTMKLKPQTAEEITECASMDGIRRRLQEYSYRGGEPLVKSVLDAARYRGLSGEDTYAWLAFEALQRLEYFTAIILKQAMLEPIPRTFANCGELVFSEAEWPIVRKAFQSVGPGTLDDIDVTVRIEGNPPGRSE